MGPKKYFPHRKEAEPEVIYLKHVEQQHKAQQAKIEETVKYPAPVFMTPLNNLVVTEGEKVRFDAKIAPAGDPNMKVEWYHNGQLVTASESSRLHSTNQPPINLSSCPLLQSESMKAQ